MVGLLYNKRIRSWAPRANETLTFGAAAQTVEWEEVLPAATNMITFGASEVIVAPATALSAVWLTSISIRINGTHEIINDFTRAEYIDFVQNLETREADIISDGNMLTKRFNPPLPAGTKINIRLVVNTLALALPGGGAGATARFLMNAYDAQEIPLGAKKMLTFYQRVPQFPPVAVMVANTPYSVSLGSEVKIVKWLFINEWAAGVLADAVGGRYELEVDGQVIARINESEAKKHYFQISDGIAVPVGRKMLKLPGDGWQAAQSTTLNLIATPRAAAAAGAFTALQVVEKEYQ